MAETTDRPSALFVCVHNAGRSQMAAGLLSAMSGGAVEVRSAGSVPAAQINPVAVAAMLELGIDIRAERPKVLDDPAGQGIESVRPIRDEIRARVLTLLHELGVEPVEVTT